MTGSADLPAPADSLAVAEAAYLDAREAWDRHAIALARGEPAVGLERAARDALGRARALVGAVPDVVSADDRHALATMLDRLATLGDEGHEGDSPLYAAYTRATESLVVDGEPIARLAILGRLAREADPARRRELFRALEPVWRVVDGDGGAASPYRALLRDAAARYSRDGSPLAANAAALGIDPRAVESWCVGILDAWRDAAGDADPIEPWDWWWAAGEAERGLTDEIPVGRLLPIARGHAASLGADVDALGIRFDLEPRAGRPPVPVASTEFGARPRRQARGDSTGQPWVFASYTQGGLGELTELVHEVGHAIHIAAIRTRPAFADWPDSDALTEAIAEVLALDTAEPAWQQAHLGAATTERESIRGRYADVALDAAWALFEIRLLAAPDQRPNDVWTSITREWLGIAPHPEWAWWAIRGQLVSDPGYMANYAIGAVLAADLRAALRREVGDWLAGNERWYAVASDRLFRFGLERRSGDVIRDLLGRAPDPRAVVSEIGRMR